MLALKAANLADAAKEYAFYAALPEDENGFTNPFFGMTEEEFTTLALPRLIGYSRGENLPEGYVPATEYFLWEDDEIVGLFRLRHELNDFLRNHAGHVGYGIHKDQRGRGLATKGLALLLEKAKEIVREEEIYMSVNRDNPASLRAQIRNGAVIHHSDEEKHYTRIRL